MADSVGAARLDISADASGVEAGVGRAKKSLATLGGAAKAAGADASKGIDKIGAGAEQSAQKLDRSTKIAINAIQREMAALEAGARSGAKYQEARARLGGANMEVLKPYLAQLEAANAKTAAATVATKAMAPAITQVGMSAKATAAALRGVPAQFTDIVTSLASGQAPITVFLQQGGQLKDMFGGLGPAARALGGYVLGLINPLTLAAAAVGVLGLAFFQGSRESDAFAKAVILSGNAAGVTVGQLQQMAERISAVTGTQSAAAEALAQFVANGTIAGDSIERFTVIALKMERETGQAVKETVKQFAELGKSPVEAATKLNEATNFLTASVAHQIKILEDQGRVADAAKVAQEAYANALESRLGSIEQRLGTLQRAWDFVATKAKKAWDAMLNIGRPDTLEDQIAKARKELAAMEDRGPLNPQMVDAFNKGLATRRAELAGLLEQQKFQQRSAQFQADEDERAKARLEFDKAGNEFLSKRARMEQEITKARKQGAAAGASQAEIDKRIADIRKNFEDKGALRSALRLDRAELGLDIERIRGEAEKLVGIYGGAEKRIETLRQAGLLSDREYFDAKRGFINLESQAKEDALQKELARLGKEKLTGADKLQNDKKIADTEAKLAILRADTSSKLEDLSLRQQQATRAEAAEFAAAKAAAEDYLQTLQRRQDQELSGFGKGRRQRDFDRGVFDIQERFGAERRSLESRRAQQEILGTFTEDARRSYERRLQLLNEYEAKELLSWEDHNRRKLEVEHDWARGAQEGLRNYADQAGNVAAQSEEFFTRTFSNLEDALAQFVQTGKISFSGLIRSILADLARLQARKVTGILADALASAIGGSFGFGGSVPDAAAAGVPGGGRAIGGPVSAGGMYSVTERGTPELLNVGGKQFLMMGNQSGTVTPAGGAGGDIHIVNNTTGRIDRVEERRTSEGDRALVLIEAVAASMGQPNSKISQAMKGNFDIKRRR